MYDLVIVDDDRSQTDAIAQAVARSSCAGQFASIEILDNPETLLRHAEEGCAFDVLIVDIVLDGAASGIDAVRRLSSLRRNVQVIYVTRHVEYCRRVYQADHVCFLTKPLDACELDRALEKALAHAAEARRRTPLVLTMQERVVRVPLDTIDYIESDRRRIRVHSEGRVVEAYAAPGDIARSLPISFIQCHKSFVVNMDRVAMLDGDEVVFEPGARVPVSQRHRCAMRDGFVTYLMEKR